MICKHILLVYDVRNVMLFHIYICFLCGNVILMTSPGNKFRNCNCHSLVTVATKTATEMAAVHAGVFAISRELRAHTVLVLGLVYHMHTQTHTDYKHTHTHTHSVTHTL